MKRIFLIFLTIFLLSSFTLAIYLSKDGISLSNWEKNVKEVGKFDKEFEINKNQIENIEITLEKGIIDIKKGEKFGFYLKSKSNLDNEEFEIKNKRLIYKGVNNEVEVVITLPEESKFDVDLEMDKVEIYVSHVNNAKVKLTIGDINMSNINYIDKIESVTGDVNLEKIGSINEVLLNIGDLRLELLNQNKEFRITNKIGDIDLYINNDFGGDINTDLGLGELKLEGLIGGDRYSAYLKSAIGDVNIKGIENVK